MQNTKTDNPSSNGNDAVLKEIKESLVQRLETFDWYANKLVAEMRHAREEKRPIDQAHETMLYMILGSFEDVAEGIDGYLKH